MHNLVAVLIDLAFSFLIL